MNEQTTKPAATPAATALPKLAWGLLGPVPSVKFGYPTPAQGTALEITLWTKGSQVLLLEHRAMKEAQAALANVTAPEQYQQLADAVEQEMNEARKAIEEILGEPLLRLHLALTKHKIISPEKIVSLTFEKEKKRW